MRHRAVAARMWNEGRSGGAGSIPPQAQPGNPAPRCFRISDHNAIVNRMGFNSRGIEDALPRLQAYHTRRQDGAADQSKVLQPLFQPR